MWLLAYLCFAGLFMTVGIFFGIAIGYHIADEHYCKPNHISVNRGDGIEQFKKQENGDLDDNGRLQLVGESRVDVSSIIEPIYERPVNDDAARNGARGCSTKTETSSFKQELESKYQKLTGCDC